MNNDFKIRADFNPSSLKLNEKQYQSSNYLKLFITWNNEGLCYAHINLVTYGVNGLFESLKNRGPKVSIDIFHCSNDVPFPAAEVLNEQRKLFICSQQEM